MPRLMECATASGAGTDLRQAKLRLHSFMAEVESGYKPGVHSDDVSWVAVAEAITHVVSGMRRGHVASHSRSKPETGLQSDAGDRIPRCSVSGIAYLETEAEVRQKSIHGHRALTASTTARATSLTTSAWSPQQRTTP